MSHSLNPMHFKTVAVVGVGLIGGSFAAGIRRAGLASEVLGVGRDPASLMHAQSLGLIDSISSLEEAAQRADLLFFSTPVGAIPRLLTQLLPHLSAHTLLTDAGSTKGNIVRAVHEILGARAGQFIPAHPIAGSEKSGADAAQVDLFQNRRVILTPLSSNRTSDIELMRAMWHMLGANTLIMEPDEHDQIYASVSHLPHLIAYAFMHQLSQQDNASLRLAAAGTGFRDFTRLAASSPEMWHDVFFANRDAILTESRQFRAVLESMERAIEDHDTAQLLRAIEPAYKARQSWSLTTSTHFK